MVDIESTLFSFTRVDDFIDLMIDREEITTSLFDGTSKNFRLVLAESCPANINECMNADYTLNTTAVKIINGTESTDGQCALSWNKGVNGDRTITIADSAVSYSFDDKSYLLKGAFLVCEQSGIVLAYSINNAPVNLSSYFTAPVGGMIWGIYNKLYEG